MSDKILNAVLFVGLLYSVITLYTLFNPIAQVYHTIIDRTLEISALMESISK